MKFSLNSSTASALHLNRTIPVSREKVFKAWTEPADLKKWWLAEGAQEIQIDLDPKADGKLELKYQTPSGDKVTQLGNFREVHKPERLVLTLEADSLHKKDGETLITVEFRKADKGGTALSITHEGLSDSASQERNRAEWVRRLDRLTKDVG
jgi:uncharacterized protein YndB with AHSA1/START domain